MSNQVARAYPQKPLLRFVNLLPNVSAASAALARSRQTADCRGCGCPQYAEPHQWNETSYTKYIDKYVSEMAGAGAGPDVLCEPSFAAVGCILPRVPATCVAADRRRLLSVLRVPVRLQPEHLDRGLPRCLGRSALRFPSRQRPLLERVECVQCLGWLPTRQVPRPGRALDVSRAAGVRFCRAQSRAAAES